MRNKHGRSDFDYPLGASKEVSLAVSLLTDYP